MKRLLISGGTALIFFLAVFILLSCNQSGKTNDERKKGSKVKDKPVNTLTVQEKADGWQLLFDGKTFNGWRGIGIKGVPEGHWDIVDGSIHKIGKKDVPRQADGQPVKGGDLITNTTFNNFILTFEWKISKGGNSGVKYNVVEAVSVKNGKTSALGYEYQVIDDVNFPEELTPKHRTAALYDMIAPNEDKVLKNVGEFNTSKIVFIGNHGEHWLNGKKVVGYDIDTPEFQESFKKSKYHDKKDFTKHKIASIVLQDHGDECWFRSIKIRRIN